MRCWREGAQFLSIRAWLSRSLFPSCGGEVRFFQVCQDFFCAFEYGRRNSSQARHLDSIRPIGTAFLEPAQENDLLADLPYGHVHVGDVGQKVAELGQLVIVRGKNRLRSNFFV